MWIDLNNDSEVTAGVGLCAAMTVKPESGKELTILPPPQQEGPSRYPVLLPEYNLSGAHVAYLLLKPHQHQMLTLPVIGDVRAATYFHEPRMSPPGRYTIALRLDYCWGGAVPQTVLLPSTFLGPVTTNEVTIERVTPTGSDAEVWKRMQDLAKGAWAASRWRDGEMGACCTPGTTILDEILAKHTDSNYLPYALLDGQASGERYVDAIKRFPDSPVTEYLRYFAAIRTRNGSAAAALRATAENNAKRPTTRIVIFGREDVERPCSPDEDCSKP